MSGCLSVPIYARIPEFAALLSAGRDSGPGNAHLHYIDTAEAESAFAIA